MLYWQRLFTLSTQSLEFSLVNEFSVPSSGPHCGLKGLFFSELLCFLPLAHLIQTCESYSPETWTSQRCFQARKLSVERHSARAQKPRPPPRRLPALAASIATPLTCHCVQPLSLGSGGFPLSRVSFLLCQVERKEILGIENIIFKDREVGNALSEKATPLRGMSLQSLGQRSLTTLHKALSVSPNSSCFPVPGTWRAAPSPCPPTTTASSPAAWTSRSLPTAATGRSPCPPSCCPTGPTTTRAAT